MSFMMMMVWDEKFVKFVKIEKRIQVAKSEQISKEK